jgi:alkyl hydroperoxide reductase subunit F
LLARKGVDVHELVVSGGTPAWDAMTARTGGRTTPQILINDEVIGGYDELAVLNAQGILDEKLGLDSGAARDLLYDVIVIGSGPAGMTAAIYSARKGLKTLVLSKDVGGQLNISAELENYLGYASIDAPTLITHFEDHVERFAITRVVGEEVVNLDVTEKIKVVATQAGNRYQGRTVIIASGKYPRPLGVLGEQRLLGKGVAYCATCDAPFYKDKVVAVVGGGNSALEAAAELQRWATHVYLIVRSTYTADDILVDHVTRMAQVEVLLGYETLEILGEQHVSGVRVQSRADGSERTLALDGVFVEIGLLPNTAFAMDVLALNDQGEIVVDCQTNTGVPGVFAAGDATNVRDKQVIIAAGEGAKAALRAHDYLLTSH